ncbi:MAG: AsmA family protein, partial [Alphaproteobacteria bacterium]|nr:AsmA family protein [Alphaproteobacteria bacterium]
MKRFLSIAVFVLLLLSGAAFLAPNFVDWNKYRPAAVAQIEAATGYKVKIGGALDMALLPSPRLLLEEFSLDLPKTQGEPLLTLDRAEVSVALFPLLKKQIVVNSVVLVHPQLRLILDEKGHLTGLPPALERENGGKQGGPAESIPEKQAVALNDIRIKDGSIHLLNLKNGRTEKIEDVDLRLNAPDLRGPYDLTARLSYQERVLALSTKVGRFEKGVDNTSLQAELSFPEDSAAVLSYSGVLALKAPFGLQGELSLNVLRPASFLNEEQKSSFPFLNDPVSLKGLLTFSGEAAALRNATFDIGGVKASGGVDMTGLAEDKALSVSVTLDGQTPLELERILPLVGLQNTSLSAKDGSVSADSDFLPETLTLPRDLNAQVQLSFPAIRYRGASLENMVLSFEKKEKRFSGDIVAGLPGKPEGLRLKGDLSYGASSSSAGKGGVTFSDPRMTFNASLDTPDILVLLRPFLSHNAQEKLVPVLSDPLRFEAVGSLSPGRIGVESGEVLLDGSRLSFSGSLASPKAGGRSLLTVQLESKELDIDRWQKKLRGKELPAGVTPVSDPAIGTFSDTLESISLPFDLNATGVLDNLSWNGFLFETARFKGTFSQKTLSIETFDLKTSQKDFALLSGKIIDLSKLNGVDISIRAGSPDLNRAVSFLPAKGEAETFSLPAAIGGGEVVATLHGDLESLSYTANVKALKGTAEAKGTVRDVLNKPIPGELSLRVRHPDYVALARMFVPSFSSDVAIRKGVDVFFDMRQKEGVYDISGLQATIGPLDAKGHMSIDARRERPFVSGDLVFGNIPLDKMVGHTAQQKGTLRVRKTGTEGDLRWSRNAIDVAWMNRFDMDMALRASSLSYANWDLQSVEMKAALQSGTLDIEKLTAALYGGQAFLSGKIKAPAKDRQPLVLTGKAKLTDVSLESFVKAFSGASLIRARGAISVDAGIESTGLSPAALVFDLHGKGVVTGRDLTLEGFDLARLSRALAAPTSSLTENFTKILDASMAGGATRFDTLDSAFTITEGVVRFDKLLLDGPDAAVTGDGNVNLPLWTIDLKTVVNLREPADAPSLETVFRGPLDNPGKTFAQNALNQYFNKQLEGLVVNPL